MSNYSKTKRDRDMRFVADDQASPGEHVWVVTCFYLMLSVSVIGFTEKNIAENPDVGVVAWHGQAEPVTFLDLWLKSPLLWCLNYIIIFYFYFIKHLQYFKYRLVFLLATKEHNLNI